MHRARLIGKTASTQKIEFPGRVVFVSCPKTRTASRENCFHYDEVASGVTIYAYVGGNPLSRIDPYGLEWQATIGIGGFIGGNPILGMPGAFGGGGLSIGVTSSGQIIVQAQATGSVGVGIFGGIGAQGQVSKTKCPTKPGMSTGQSVQGDANFGAGPSIGGSVQYDNDGGGSFSTGVGKVGVGYGAQGSVGITQTVTLATPALFPSNTPQCGCP